MKTLSRILSYSKKYWKQLLLSGVTASLYGLFSAAPTYILKNAVDDIFIRKMNNYIIPFILGFILLFIIKGVFMYFSNYYMHFVGNKVVNDIRADFLKRIIHYPLSFFKEHSTGQLISYFLNDIQMIQQASSIAIKNGVRSFFEAIFLIGVAFSQNWKLASIMLLVGPLIGIAINKMGRSVKKASVDIQKNIGSISSMLQEIFIGIREVKAFNGEELEVKRFNNYLQSTFKSIMKNIHAQSLGPALIESIAMIGGGVVLYIASNQILDGTITAGQLTSFFAAVLLSYQPLKRLINVYTEIHYGLAAAKKIFNIMDKIYPAERAHKLISLKNKKIESLVFKNVYFSYDGKNNIINNFNLNIKKGDRIGILGPSGIGKSTFCDLILNFISPTKGNIYINGHNLLNIDIKELRDRIGYVSQKTFLFNDSILNNLKYSQNNISLSDIKVACTKAHASEFIEKFPDKYNTIVGENGNNLSGGQKQRLTIARALLKKPEILIFDEPTSALDYKSEELIKKTIAEIDRNIIVIVISHRRSLIDSMDTVLTFNNMIAKELEF